jgi:ribose 5-phosphate isomerase B
MKIGIGNDHKGLKLKNQLYQYLYKNGFDIVDYGTNDNTSVDYPDYAKKIGTDVSSKTLDLGILICGTGIGMSISCNRIKGARCAKVNTVKESKLARLHNDANVIALGGNNMGYKAKRMVKAFINTNYSNEERHNKRIEKIEL